MKQPNHPKGPAKADPTKERKLWAANRLAILDSRLGVGVGALRERKRLIAILNPDAKTSDNQ